MTIMINSLYIKLIQLKYKYKWVWIYVLRLWDYHIHIVNMNNQNVWRSFSVKYSFGIQKYVWRWNDAIGGIQTNTYFLNLQTEGTSYNSNLYMRNYLETITIQINKGSVRMSLISETILCSKNLLSGFSRNLLSYAVKLFFEYNTMLSQPYNIILELLKYYVLEPYMYIIYVLRIITFKGHITIWDPGISIWIYRPLDMG